MLNPKNGDLFKTKIGLQALVKSVHKGRKIFRAAILREDGGEEMLMEYDFNGQNIKGFKDSVLDIDTSS